MKMLLLLAVLLVTAGFLAVGAYYLVSPEVEVVNESDANLDRVTVTLPANRIVFDTIAPGASTRIFHTSEQSDGVYEYAVALAGAGVIAGSCGYVTNTDHGKRLELVVLPDRTVECRESHKLWLWE